VNNDKSAAIHVTARHLSHLFSYSNAHFH